MQPDRNTTFKHRLGYNMLDDRNAVRRPTRAPPQVGWVREQTDGFFDHSQRALRTSGDAPLLRAAAPHTALAFLLPTLINLIHTAHTRLLDLTCVHMQQSTRINSGAELESGMSEPAVMGIAQKLRCCKGSCRAKASLTFLVENQI